MEPIRITHNADDVAARLRAAPDILVAEVEPAIYEASLLVEREVVEHTPTSGAGTLRDSIGALPVTFDGEVIEGGVGTALAYALPVEEGSRPHMPPAEPIMDWVRRRLGVTPDEVDDVAEKIRWKIARYGTPARHMFRDGFEAASAQAREIIAAGVARALARIGG
ncbi:MAG: HK97 gp10 family phage protein [Zavarzinia sp.]|nr:HK97 gp10 family phage protein [Zavarzinia sp.]